MRALITVCTNDTLKNGRAQYTIQCLPSIDRTVDLKNHQLVIVQNGSDDPESTDFIKEFSLKLQGEGKNVRVLNLYKNMHATYAYNRIIRDMWDPDEFFFFRVENDMVFETPAWVAGMMDILAGNPDVATASPLPASLIWRTSLRNKDTITGKTGRIYNTWNTGGPGGFAVAYQPEFLKTIRYLAVPVKYDEETVTAKGAVKLGYKMVFTQPEQYVCYHIDKFDNTFYQHQKRDMLREDGIKRKEFYAKWKKWPVASFRVKKDDGEYII